MKIKIGLVGLGGTIQALHMPTLDGSGIVMK